MSNGTQQRKVVILDDQDGPQFFYEDIVVSLLSAGRGGVLKCRSLEEANDTIKMANTTDLEIAAVLGDIEILEHAKDALPSKKCGILALEKLVRYLLATHSRLYQKMGTKSIVFNYVLLSRYVSDSTVYTEVEGTENKLDVYLPHKLARPVGSDKLKAVLEEVFDKMGL